MKCYNSGYVIPPTRKDNVAKKYNGAGADVHAPSFI